MDVASLQPGTTLRVLTRNSEYRVVILLDPRRALVQGGAMFPEATIVRLDGAAAGSLLKVGWILVGFQMEMWLDFMPLRSSYVRSISIESIPPVPAFGGLPHA